ncbi:MAG: CHC2 zinc finger domain-containing protein, partial [Gaiellaceae bacterium]
AHALGADRAATDAARILRPPHTCNFKHDPPTAVVLERLSDERQMAADVIDGLPELPTLGGRVPDPGPALRRGDPLRTIEPQVYVEALTGQRVGRDRKVRCPFHEDATPSLHVYEGAEGGWYCFSCKRGTSVYDLAGPLWGLRTRGVEFLELRRRLTELLLPDRDGEGRTV